MSLSTVCVYCGSSDQVAPEFKEAAHVIGKEIAKRGLRVVYGGGHVGLMGIVADAALEAGGQVVGIIPEHIRTRELQHNKLTELHVVPNMHTRKRMMVDRADAFIILPGGFGTLDETFEILTWKKLKLLNNPIILVNLNGYWDEILHMIDKMIKEKFAGPEDAKTFEVVPTAEAAIAALDKAMPLREMPLIGQI